MSNDVCFYIEHVYAFGITRYQGILQSFINHGSY